MSPSPDDKALFARLRRALAWATPGQLDAGFASLATFITGLVAVRELSTASLAAYALLTSAYHLLNQFPGELVFSPSQIIAVDLPTRERLGALAHSVPRGAAIGALSSLAVPAGALLVAREVAGSDLFALSVSATLLATASPLQDHVRAVLHMAKASWVAAAMSITNFAATGLTMLAFSSSVAWTVFGALFVGNVLSLVVGGIWIARRRTPPATRPPMRHLIWLGGWLLATGLSKTGIRYGVNALLGMFAGVAALGYVESARVVAQPVNVLSQGLMSQVGPQLTLAASRRDHSMSRRWTRRFVLLLAVVTVPYVVLVATPWALNPFSVFAARAYTVPGLVSATLLVVTASAVMRSQRLQLLGGRQQQLVARVTFMTGVLELASATTAVAIGPYASPLASGLAVAISIVWFATALRRIYSGAPETPPSP